VPVKASGPENEFDEPTRISVSVTPLLGGDRRRAERGKDE
jgi:hypothetical protein